MLVACAPFLFLDINDEPFLPSEQEVLPLPSGMTAEVKPVGWLFDQRELCASVIERNGRVIVGLESGRAWP